MKNKIADLAGKLGISVFGVCLPEEYLSRACGNDLPCAEEMLTGMKSIITFAFGYFSGNKKGNISRYARGIDYHKVTGRKLKEICVLLEQNGYCARAFADTGPLNERLLATLSGIAFRGKNQMVINDRLGSYFFIGYIVTDCELEADAENKNSCLGCGRCVEMCPTGALSDNEFDKMSCLSDITQRRGELTPAERSAIMKTGTAWGCDICQEVCPHNKAPERTAIAEFRDDLIFDLDVDEELSNKEFKRLYADRAFSWRGKNVLIRNQKILKNRKKVLDKISKE